MNALRFAVLSLALLLGGCVCAAGEAECEGACTDLATSAIHCGACGRTCLAGQRCVDGECRGAGFLGARCAADADCDDGLGCNGAERCIHGGCRRGVILDCDDGIACTVEECVEPGSCVSTPDHGRCSGGSCVGEGPNGCVP